MLKEFREAYPQVDIVTSAPFDYIELKQQALERHIQVVLAYDNLKKQTPTRSNVVLSASMSSDGVAVDPQRDRDAEDAFKVMSVSEAYKLFD
jgi:hypothetical protein